MAALKALFEDTCVAEKERAAASRGSSRKCDFTSKYLYLLASAWGVEASLSRRKMPLLMAIITKAAVQKATSRGIQQLDELTDEKTAELMPATSAGAAAEEARPAPTLNGGGGGGEEAAAAAGVAAPAASAAAEAAMSDEGDGMATAEEEFLAIVVPAEEDQRSDAKTLGAWIGTGFKHRGGPRRRALAARVLVKAGITGCVLA